MNSYTVYRVDYLTNKTEPVGTIVDRRKKERNSNVSDMLRLAQKLYATSSIHSHIYIGPSESLPPGARTGIFDPGSGAATR